MDRWASIASHSLEGGRAMLERRQQSMSSVWGVLALSCCLAVEAAGYTCTRVTATDGTVGDKFGQAVAMDGEHAIICAPEARPRTSSSRRQWLVSASHAGSARVARRLWCIRGHRRRCGRCRRSKHVGRLRKGVGISVEVPSFARFPRWTLEDTLYNEDSSGPDHHPIPHEGFGGSLRRGSIRTGPERSGLRETTVCTPAHWWSARWLRSR